MRRASREPSQEQSFRRFILSRAALLRPAPEHPARLKLFNAYMRLLRRWLALARLSPNRTYSIPLFQGRGLELGMLELLTWLSPEWITLPDAEREQYCHKMLEVYQAAQVPFREAARYVLSWGERRRRGRPGSIRFAAISAYEEKLHEEKRGRTRTWAELTKKHCPCNKAAHDVNFTETIKREVRLFKAILRKYRNPQEWQPNAEMLNRVLQPWGTVVRPLRG